MFPSIQILIVTTVGQKNGNFLWIFWAACKLEKRLLIAPPTGGRVWVVLKKAPDRHRPMPAQPGEQDNQQVDFDRRRTLQVQGLSTIWYHTRMHTHGYPHLPRSRRALMVGEVFHTPLRAWMPRESDARGTYRKTYSSIHASEKKYWSIQSHSLTGRTNQTTLMRTKWMGQQDRKSTWKGAPSDFPLE